MKKLVLPILLCTFFSSLAQEANQIRSDRDYNPGSPVFVKHQQDVLGLQSTDQGVYAQTRGDESVWFNFSNALNIYLASATNYYTLLFPDTLNSIFEDGNNPGTYSLGTVRAHSVGSCFSPASDILEGYGYDRIKKEQPYHWDSIAIEYNYMRFTEGNTPDTLIINIFSPQKLLYYTDIGNPTGLPRGGSVRYDSVHNKGREYDQEIVYLLTNDDTITYKGRGKGLLKFPVNMDITAGSYGNPVAVSWSYKPGHAYNLTDTLNGDFSQSVPHSKINHFIFWNYTDKEDFETDEFNNGLYIYSWTNAAKYVNNTSYGALYWRGSSFSGRRTYPDIWFKLTYDPEWESIQELGNSTISEIYPNPSSDEIAIDLELNSSENLTFEIFDMQGKRLYLENQPFNAGSSSWRKSIASYQSGLYTLSVNNGTSAIKKTFLKP